MNKQRRSRRAVQLFASASIAAVVAVYSGIVTIGQNRTPAPPSPDLSRDLPMKISAPFTVTTTGDLILMRPVSHFEDAGLQGVIKLIRDADLAYGNFEASISDLKTFKGAMGGFMGTKEVAGDLKAMGFDIVNRANNHTFDSQEEGMFETDRLLDEAGIVHAGTGKNLHDARAAAFLETAKGRVGLVSMHSLNPGGDAGATYRLGNMGGRPGLNPLGLSIAYIVTQEQMDSLRKVRDALYTPLPGVSNPVQRGGRNNAELPLPANEPPGRLQLFGTTYKVGPTPGIKNHTMNQDDLRDILRSIRNAKQYADFVVAAIHAHQGPYVAQKWEFEDEPPDFLIELAHKAIDNGADVFAGSGPHVLRGIEIYKGKPIFYDQGEFFREMDLPAVGLGTYRLHGLDPFTTELTETELNKQEIERRDVRAPLHYQSYLATSRYDNGKLAEVRIYPTDLRRDGPTSRAGIPQSAPPEIAQQILGRVQMLSKKLGTTVTIDGNVGVIRVQATTPTAAGQP